MTDRQKEAMTKLQKYIMEIHRIPMHKVPDFCGQLWNLADDIAEDLPVSTELAITRLDEMLGESKTEGRG